MRSTALSTLLLMCQFGPAGAGAAEIFAGGPGATRKPDQTVRDAMPGVVTAVAYSADGNTLAALSGDRVRLWDLKNGTVSPDLVRVAHLPPASDPALAVAPASAVLVRCAGDRVQLLDAASGQTRQELEFRLAPGCPVALSRDGKVLAAATADGKIGLWDLAAGSAPKISPGPPVRSAEAGPSVEAVAAGASYFAAGYRDGTVKLWPVEGASSPRVWAGHRGPIHAVALSVDGAQLASAGANGTIKVWDVQTGGLLSTLEGHSGEVQCLAFSPNGRTIASGGADRTIRYWTMPLPPVPSEDLRKIEAAVLSTASAVPKKPRKVLVFWRADAIQHKTGVPAANQAIALLAQKTGAFQVDYSRDYDVLDLAILSKYDAVLMNSTAHLAIPDEAKKQAFLDYVKGGGGIIGIHAAIDTFKDWPAGAEVIGATFGGHPFVPTGYWAVKIEDSDHRLTRAFGGKGFVMHDEIYEMGEPYTRANRRVLLSLDLSDPATAAVMRPIPGKESTHREDKDFAVAWVKHYGAGRVFYADFGHVAGPFQNPAVLQFYLDGIQYVLGDLEADDSPKARRN
jgi:type 1 glutamine amidotransferase